MHFLSFFQTTKSAFDKELSLSLSQADRYFQDGGDKVAGIHNSKPPIKDDLIYSFPH
jgi:hypothetical protein